MTAVTLADPIELSGVGLHSGAAATIILHPVEQAGWWISSGSGTVHRLQNCRPKRTRWQTVLQLPDGAEVATIEHVMAALSGLSAACRLELHGPEIPILDGSALPFVEAILEAGLVPCHDSHEGAFFLALSRSARVSGPSGSWIEVEPAPERTLEVTVELGGRTLGPVVWGGGADPFAAKFAPARTFALESWVKAQQAAGMAAGGSLSNALVLSDEGQPLNLEGERLPFEPARHKLLDLLGDLSQLGGPLQARIRAFRPGHTLNAALVEALRPLCHPSHVGATTQSG